MQRSTAQHSAVRAGGPARERLAKSRSRMHHDQLLPVSRPLIEPSPSLLSGPAHRRLNIVTTTTTTTTSILPQTTSSHGCH